MSKQDPKILLIYPPNQLMPNEIPRPDGSLGLLYLAGALREKNIQVEILDASVGAPSDNLEDTFFRQQIQDNGLVRIGMTKKRLKDFFQNGNYDIIGIHNNFTPQTKMALEVAAVAKEIKPNTLVIAGGVSARALAPRLLTTGLIDLITTSYAEKTIIDIVLAWQNNMAWDTLSAVVFRKNGKNIFKPVTKESIYHNLDELPFPAWDLLPFDKYDQLNSPHGSIITQIKHRYAPIMTSRGCPFACAYCHNSKEKQIDTIAGDIGLLRCKSINRVMKEIEKMRALDVNHIYIEDDSFLAIKPRAIEILTKFTNLDLKISNVNGINLLHLAKLGNDGKLHPDKEYLQIIKKSGFDEIVFPVESGCQRIINKYASGKLDLAKFDMVELIQTATQIGITCPVNIMIGFPDETEDEIFQSINLARQLIKAGAHYVTFFIPIPFPGCQLFEYAINNGHLDPDFDPDSMNWKNACMKNTIVPPARIVELRDWAWNDVNREEYKHARLKREIGTRLALNK